MTGVAIAAGAAAVAAGVGGYMNYQAQKSANRTNESLMREQMAYQTSERLATQEYNTPLAQRQRFEAAGINPYMALGNIDAGNTTAQSAVGTPDIQPERLGDAISEFGAAPDKVMQSVSMAQQIQGQEEAIKQARAETLYKERNLKADLDNKLADIKVKLAGKDLSEQQKKVLQQQEKDLEAQAKMHQIDLDYHEQLTRSRNSREENLARLAYEQTLGQHLQNEYQSLVNDAFPELNAAQIASLKAQTAASYAQADLSRNMSNTEIERKAGIITENQIKDLEKKGWQKKSDQEIRLYRANVNYIIAATRKTQNSNNWVQNYSPFVSGAASVGAMMLK